MKIKHIPFGLLTLFTLANSSMAYPIQPIDPLQVERDKVVNQYILDLQQADYKDISTLFDKNGIVISTSRGEHNAKDFFVQFLSQVVSATTEVHQTFHSNDDSKHYGARFHFHFELKDGEKGDGEYVDEFIFNDHSTKLSAVYMFENLKFNNAK